MTQPLFTGIGSLPYATAEAAVAHVLDHYGPLPFVPQLPQASAQEGMLAQAAAGLPLVELDETGRSLRAAGRVADLRAAWDEWLRRPLDSIEPPATLHRQVWQAIKDSLPAGGRLKSQVTGPITFAAALLPFPDEAGAVRDRVGLAAQVIVRRAEWELEQIRQAGRTAVLFLDEPGLGASGGRKDLADAAYGALRETITELRARAPRGSLIGLHCCAPASWEQVLSLPLDLVSFDAARYLDDFLARRAGLTAFLERDGVVAWGVIPTERSPGWTVPTALASWRTRTAAALGDRADLCSRAFEQLLFTPACGTGRRSPAESEGVTVALVEWARDYSMLK
jgi:hypothetical protein